MPNPMHPLSQLPRHLLRIVFNTRSAHSEKDTRLPTRFDNTLSPRSTNLVIGVEYVGNLRAVRRSGRVREEVLEDEGVFERLARALSLPGCSRVRGVADQCDAAFGVCRGQGVVPDCPFGEFGVFEKLWLR